MERALAKLIAYTLGSATALFFAQRVVSGVTYTGGWEILAIAGFAIALLNLAVAPILKVLSLPLRILTFNLFSLVIDMAMIWLTDVLLGSQLEIAGLIPLFWTTLFVAVLNFLLWTLILSPSFKS